MEKQDVQSKVAYITKSIEFSAAHFYYIEEWSERENKQKFGLCSDKSSHGHNYVLHVTLKGLPDSKTGMIINLIDLKEILKDKVLSKFDHKNLNLDVAEFKNCLPTTENLCLIIWNTLQLSLKKKLATVLLFEDEDLSSYYQGESNMLYITRVYRFSASHRLNNDALSEEENLRIFGKCNNYNAHGHNFKLEITLKGNIDPITGMVYDLLTMDGIVDELILKQMDHKNLSENVENLKGFLTTGENLTKYIWDKLVGKFEPARLHKIRLYETDRNYFEYRGEENGY